MHTVDIPPKTPLNPATSSRCARCASSRPSAATSTCASRPRRRAQEGIAGHGVVTARRPAGYERNQARAMSTGRSGARPRRRLRSRREPARGDQDLSRRLDAMPATTAHLHWAQARIYGWLLCEERGLPSIELALVYFDIASQTETVLRRNASAPMLREHFEAAVRSLPRLGRAGSRAPRRRATRRWPRWPFRTPRSAPDSANWRRRSIARRSARALPARAGADGHRQDGRHAVSAAEGVAGQQLDKIFFLTAKTAGPAAGARRAAHALDARSRRRCACSNWSRATRPASIPDRACHGESCPLARGFYDRLPAARGGRARAAPRSIGRRCAQSRSRTRSARTTWRRNWCAGATWSSATTTTTSTRAPCCTRSPRRTTGASSVLVDEAHNLRRTRARHVFGARSIRPRSTPCAARAPPSLETRARRVLARWNGAAPASRPPTTRSHDAAAASA